MTFQNFCLTTENDLTFLGHNVSNKSVSVHCVIFGGVE